MCNFYINSEQNIDYDDYLETYNNYLQYLNEFEDKLFENVIYDIAVEIKYILFQNRVINRTVFNKNVGLNVGLH